MLVDTNESFAGRTRGKVSFVIFWVARTSPCVSIGFEVAAFKAFNISSGLVLTSGICVRINSIGAAAFFTGRISGLIDFSTAVIRLLDEPGSEP